jgi:hypothetical protein
MDPEPRIGDSEGTVRLAGPSSGPTEWPHFRHSLLLDCFVCRHAESTPAPKQRSLEVGVLLTTSDGSATATQCWVLDPESHPARLKAAQKRMTPRVYVMVTTSLSSGGVPGPLFHSQLARSNPAKSPGAAAWGTRRGCAQPTTNGWPSAVMSGETSQFAPNHRARCRASDVRGTAT